MKIQVNITKKYFIIILISIFAISTLLLTLAYNSNFDKTASQAINFGHSADEIVVQTSSGLKTVQELLEVTSNACIKSSIYECSIGNSSEGKFAGNQFSKSVQPIIKSVCQNNNTWSYIIDCSCSFVNQICVPTNTCGNGVVDASEICDDGNQNNYDSCNSNCQNNNRIRLSGARFKDGHVINVDSLGLSTLDDFRTTSRGDGITGPDAVCRALEGNFNTATNYYLKTSAFNYVDGHCNYDGRTNNNWQTTSSCSVPQSLGIYVWIECA